MTSKLPVRRNIAPLFKIAENIERTLNLKNDKIYRKFSANFDGDKNVVKDTASVRQPLPINTIQAKVDPISKVSRETSPIVVSELRSEDELERVTKHNWKLMVSEEKMHYV